MPNLQIRLYHGYISAGKKPSVCRIQYCPWFQAPTGGFGMQTLRIRGSSCTSRWAGQRLSRQRAPPPFERGALLFSVFTSPICRFLSTLPFALVRAESIIGELKLNPGRKQGSNRTERWQVIPHFRAPDSRAVWHLTPSLAAVRPDEQTSAADSGYWVAPSPGLRTPRSGSWYHA